MSRIAERMQRLGNRPVVDVSDHKFASCPFIGRILVPQGRDTPCLVGICRASSSLAEANRAKAIFFGECLGSFTGEPLKDGQKSSMFSIQMEHGMWPATVVFRKLDKAQEKRMIAELQIEMRAFEMEWKPILLAEAEKQALKRDVEWLVGSVVEMCLACKVKPINGVQCLFAYGLNAENGELSISLIGKYERMGTLVQPGEKILLESTYREGETTRRSYICRPGLSGFSEYELQSVANGTGFTREKLFDYYPADSGPDSVRKEEESGGPKVNYTYKPSTNNRKD
jgi:hypothetical protein